MICDMADVDMRQVNEEEKNPQPLAPTPSAAHNPDFTMTGDGGEFQATKKSEMSKTSKSKDASYIPKMENIPKDGKSASKK